MTCIVGLEHAGKVYIGGDSAGVGGYRLTVRADTKVFTKVGLVAGATREIPWVMGFTSSFRMGQLLRYKLELPRVPATGDLDGFMVTEFVDAVRKALREGGWLEKEKDVEAGGVFVVGVRGQLFTVYSDFQISRAVAGYVSVGCGDDLALGSMHTTTGLDVTPERRITAALEAAAHHSAGVTGPFVIEVAG